MNFITGLFSAFRPKRKTQKKKKPKKHPHASGYTAPKHLGDSYGTPAAAAVQAGSTYGAPSAKYRSPGAGYGPPQAAAGYGAPSSSYRVPNSAYESPDTSGLLIGGPPPSPGFGHGPRTPPFGPQEPFGHIQHTSSHSPVPDHGNHIGSDSLGSSPGQIDHVPPAPNPNLFFGGSENFPQPPPPPPPGVGDHHHHHQQQQQQVRQHHVLGSNFQVGNSVRTSAPQPAAGSFIISSDVQGIVTHVNSVNTGFSSSFSPQPPPPPPPPLPPPPPQSFSSSPVFASSAPGDAAAVSSSLNGNFPAEAEATPVRFRRPSLLPPTLDYSVLSSNDSSSSEVLECGSSTQAAEFALRSPNYPLDYPNGADCQYRVLPARRVDSKQVPVNGNRKFTHFVPPYTGSLLCAAAGPVRLYCGGLCGMQGRLLFAWNTGR